MGDGAATTVALPRALVLSAARPTDDDGGAPSTAPERRPQRAPRARAAAWAALLMAALLVPVDLAAWQALRAAVDGRADRLIAAETAAFRAFATDNTDPATGAEFADVGALLRAYLDGRRPGPHEVALGHVDGDPGGLVSAERAAREEILASARARGETETPQGLLRWEKVRVEPPREGAGDGRRGWFVAGYLVDSDMAGADRTAGVLALVSLGGTAAAGWAGWALAGRAAPSDRPGRGAAPARRAVGRAAGPGDDDDEAGEGPADERPGTGDRGGARGGSDDAARLGERFAALAALLAEAAPPPEGESAGERSGMARAAGGRPPVADELDRMARIAEDLRLLTEAARPGFLRPSKVSVAELTVDLDARLRARGDREWRLDEIADGTAYLDPARVTQAMERLARNAVRHTQPGAAIHTGSAFSADGRTVSLWVADSGPGIAEDDQDRVFAPFALAGGEERPEGGADDSGRPHGRADRPGAGLGLAVVRAVARAHGGTVVVRSAPGEGAVLRLVLPVDAREPHTS
ncbi:HAMP domain-containing sensor histidine kinase [Streptomonospora nanhaiensis]|uniref:HAMP domain-containing sensor histidine kinase n=1 Tax=Streptomonospora nanhaiensis TaxID=1323731 RepID=UPI0030B8C1C3